MQNEEARAISDEMLIRILCAAYSVTHEREKDLNDGLYAAALLTGAVRFAIALAHANGADEKWMHDRVCAMYSKEVLGVKAEDPGVSRWVETFRQMYGANVPFAFALRDQQDPLN